MRSLYQDIYSCYKQSLLVKRYLENTTVVDHELVRSHVYSITHSIDFNFNYGLQYIATIIFKSEVKQARTDTHHEVSDQHSHLQDHTCPS